MLSKVEWFFKYLFIHCGFTLPTLLWFRFKVQEFKQKGSSTVLNQVNWTESFNCVRNQAGGTWGEDVLEQHYKVKLCDDGRWYEHRCYAEGSRCIKYILQTLKMFLWRFWGPGDPERDSDVGHISVPRAAHSGSTLHLQPQTRGGGHGNMNQGFLRLFCLVYK